MGWHWEEILRNTALSPRKEEINGRMTERGSITSLHRGGNSSSSIDLW